MGEVKKNILAVNGGSSSIKFALYDVNGTLSPRLTGKIEKIGLPEAQLTFKDIADQKGGHKKEGEVQEEHMKVQAGGMNEAADFLLGWLQKRQGAAPLLAIGHRIVHGLNHREPALIDEGLLAELQTISSYDPDHLPGEIQLIRLFGQHDPSLPQVACFDTAFHATLPRVAKLLPLPRRYDQKGLQRYGFHGLSYSYIVEELTRIDPDIADGAVIVAHLGSGASLAAIREGRSIDTSMGFTPTGGIMMSTRTGDIDPGALWWILQNEKLTPEQLSDLVNHQSGLLGVSGISSDMQDLLAKEGSDTGAAEAVALFCYQIKKHIGAYTAALGGLDAIVFTGGIGEKAAAIRARICTGLEYLGIQLDQRANARNELLISVGDTRVRIYVIPTNEELMIARAVQNLIKPVKYDSDKQESTGSPIVS
jgi:acetate kinase